MTLSWDKVCSCPEILYGSTLQAADQVLPLLKSLKDGLLTTAGLGHHRGFSLPFGLFDTIAWFLFFFFLNKTKCCSSTECHNLPILLPTAAVLVFEHICFYNTVGAILPPSLLLQCWCFNLKILLFERMWVVPPNNSISVTMATAFYCWVLECEKEKNSSHTDS